MRKLRECENKYNDVRSLSSYYKSCQRLFRLVYHIITGIIIFLVSVCEIFAIWTQPKFHRWGKFMNTLLTFSLQWQNSLYWVCGQVLWLISSTLTYFNYLQVYTLRSHLEAQIFSSSVYRRSRGGNKVISSVISWEL